MTMQVTVFRDSDVPVVVVDGPPPVDQTALVASLQASVAQLTADLVTMTTLRNTAETARAALATKIANAQTAVTAVTNALSAVSAALA